MSEARFTRFQNSRWALAWALTSVIVAMLFFWLKSAGYKGALWLWLMVPVIPFTATAKWFGNEVAYLICAIVYGGIVSLWFLPEKYHWSKKARSIALIYLAVMLCLGIFFYLGAQLGGGI
jgi:hypothetical protein